MSMKKSIPLTAGLSLLLLTACGTKEQEPERVETPGESTLTLTQEQFTANGFALGKPEKRSFHRTVVSSGVLDVPPENRAHITTIVGGIVKKAPLLVGDQVTKGQELLVLESQEALQLQQRYLEVHNQLDFLRAEFERNLALFRENITSEKNFLAAKSNYETHRATHQGLAQQLRLLHILPESVEQGKLVSQLKLYSPIGGRVAQTHITLGSPVSPATEIMEIVDNAHMHLELNVYEKDILEIRKGQTIRFKIPGASQEQFLGKVQLLGAAIDPKDRSIKVHGDLERTDDRLIPGMFVEATILTDSIQGWALPDGAVIASEGGTHVLRLLTEGDGELRFERVAVTAGPHFEGHVQILSGIDPEGGSQYLVKGAFDLIGG